jgi:hypothetical protein
MIGQRLAIDQDQTIRAGAILAIFGDLVKFLELLRQYLAMEFIAATYYQNPYYALAVPVGGQAFNKHKGGRDA